MKRLKRRAKVGLSLAGLGLGYLAGCTLLAHGYLSPIRKAPGPRPDWMRPDHEGEISFWIGGSGDSATYVMAHGYGGSQAEWVPLANRLRKRGLVLIPAMRGQTVSPLPRVDFGPGEAADLVALARWSKRRWPERPVVLIGVSLGGAASWLASAEDPEAVDGVVTEAAFARLEWATSEFLSSALPGGSVLLAPVPLLASWMLGRSPASVRPDLAARRWRGRPAGVIHGTADRMFSARHPRSIAQALDVQIEWFEGAGHAEASRLDAARFERIVLEVTYSARSRLRGNALDGVDSQPGTGSVGLDQ